MPQGPSRWNSSAPIRYPDPDIVVLDKRFRHLMVPMAAIERIASGFRFTEGPAYYGDGRYLLFSDIPNDALLRWDEITGQVATLRNPAGHPDGNTRDRQGRLITCELGSRTLTRTEHDGTVTVLASSFESTRLTGPNDVIVKSDGTIWFSDNGAGIRSNYMGDRAPKEMPYRVYKLDPETAKLTIAVGDMERPNGLAFSPDESKLYVIESAPEGRSIYVFDVVDGGVKLANGRMFINCEKEETPDGFRVDVDDNLWCGWGMSPALDGVKVFNPAGKAIGFIALPERAANVCFGGRIQYMEFQPKAASRRLRILNRDLGELWTGRINQQGNGVRPRYDFVQ